MSRALSEYLTAQFYAWEGRGRGWHVFPQAVELEPEFVPFFGHFAPEMPQGADLGRRPRFFPRLQEALGLYQKPEGSTEKAFADLEETYEVNAFLDKSEEGITEIEISFSGDTRIPFEHIEQLLIMLSSVGGIVSFELIGTGENIRILFACRESAAPAARSFLQTYAPGVLASEKKDVLRHALLDRPTYLIDLGLRDECMLPLRVWKKYDPDPLAAAISVLESLRKGEAGVLQVLFQGALHPWAESVMRAVSDGEKGSFFEDAPNMLPLAREKVSSPLFFAVVRAIGQAADDEGALSIAISLARSLIAFENPQGNAFVPLPQPASGDIGEALGRKSKRVGMLLGSEELAGLVHVPDRSVLSPKLRAHSGKTKRAPLMVEGHPFVLGLNAHLGQEVTVTLSDEQRLRHMHVIGATGTGKSTLLLNMIAGDIRAGRGVAVLDPHGDLIDGAIKHIPDERLKDVVLVDPSDTEYPIGLNLLSARSEAEKVILSSDLVALFRRFATSWGDQMTSVLANAVNAVLESEGGGTLIDLRRFLVERGFRERFLQSVGDPNIAYYWQHEFHLQKTNSVAPILTRLDTFLRPRIVRNMMAQKVGLDFGEILNKGKVLLVKLPQGLIGEENSYLLGTLVVAKLHQAAQARQGLAPEERTPFFFYIDEFQHFVTPSMSAILSGARKYGLGLVLAHQDLEQLFQKDAELAGSVMSNPGIRVCFRSGDKDAARLEGGFSHFDATDLQNLGTGQAIVRVLAKDNDFNLAFSLPPKVGPEAAEGKRKTVVENSRSRYAAHESEVEEVLRASLGPRPAPERQRPPEVRVENPILISEELPQAAEEEAPVKDLQTEAEKFVEKEAERERQREHRFSQEFVKKVAEARNFKAVLEEPVNDNTGKVDVSLVRDSLRIACEISVTNTPEYEVQNISKCLKAGFDLVFMVSGDERHLNEIRALAAKEIPTEHHGKVFFTSKEGFVRELDTFLSLKTGPVETRTKGYRVKVSYGGAEGAAAQQRLLKEVLSASARGKG